MLVYPDEVVQNQPLTSEGVIVQNGLWSREVCFLRVAASSDIWLRQLSDATHVKRYASQIVSAEEASDEHDSCFRYVGMR